MNLTTAIAAMEVSIIIKITMTIPIAIPTFRIFLVSYVVTVLEEVNVMLVTFFVSVDDVAAEYKVNHYKTYNFHEVEQCIETCTFIFWCKDCYCSLSLTYLEFCHFFLNQQLM